MPNRYRPGKYNNRGRSYIECQQCGARCMNTNGVQGNFCSPECRAQYMSRFTIPRHQRHID